MNFLKKEEFKGVTLLMQNKEDFLGTEPIGKLLFRLSIPTVVAQLINMLYNIVDRIYIGHIPGEGSLALTGVGVCMPIIMIVSAFAALVSSGGAPRASIFMGKKDQTSAEKILGNCFALQIIISCILTAILLRFNEPLLLAFGASSNTISYATAYMQIYAFGTLFVQLTLGMNAFITAQGFTTISMVSVLIGAVCNIILDPVFIFVLHLGVRGAAIATILSQAVSAAWVVHFLTSEKTVMHLSLKNMRLRADVIKMIAGLGISPFIMQSTESLVTITLNTGLQRYGGDLYVGSMSILMSIMQLITIPVQGITQGIQPIISYNYGAGNKERVKDTMKRMILVCLAGTLLLAGVAILAPQIYTGLFTNNQELLKLTCQVMPVYFLGISIFGIQCACQTSFISLGQAKVSLFIALLRKIILLIPLAIILPKFMGVMGIYRAEPIADVISVVTTSVVFIYTMKKVLRNM